jgi:hypothetical protein
MYTLPLLPLVYVLITSTTFHVSAGVEVASSAQLLSDGFLAFGNYEVLSTHEDGEEDIVHIRKRAEKKNCETDCMNCSGWTDDGKMNCPSEGDNEDFEPEDMSGNRAIVKRGGPKDAT